MFTPDVAKKIALIGLGFMGALLLAYACTLVAVARVFAGLSDDVASSITGQVAAAMIYLVYGFALAIPGAILCLIAAWPGNFRPRWLYRWWSGLLIPWLPVWPVGTLLGGFGILMLMRFRREFAAASTLLDPAAEASAPSLPKPADGSGGRSDA